MSGVNNNFIRSIESIISSSGFSGDFVFSKSDGIDLNGPKGNNIEYFQFVDGSGDPVTTTGEGVVTINYDTGNGVYHCFKNGEFLAKDSIKDSVSNPSYYGKLTNLKVTITGTVTGAVGFKLLLSQNGDAAATVAKGSLDVKIQDQHTPVVDLFLSQLIQTVDITTNTAVDDSVVTITSAAQPTNGNIICLKEDGHFYQGKILSSVANASDWDVTLDTPLDYPFTTVGGCSERNINLAVDGSTVPVEFIISPSDPTKIVSWDITRFMASVLDATAMDDGTFGGIPALTNGCYLRIENGIKKNLVNIKTNGDWSLRSFDVTYSNKAPAGQFGLTVRKSYAGQEKAGVTLRITDDDTITMVVQDDLTGLISFQMVAQGHIVDFN